TLVQIDARLPSSWHCYCPLEGGDRGTHGRALQLSRIEKLEGACLSKPEHAPRRNSSIPCESRGPRLSGRFSPAPRARRRIGARCRRLSTGLSQMKIWMQIAIATAVTCVACGGRAVPLPDPPVVRSHDG